MEEVDKHGTDPLTRDSDRDLFGDAIDPLPTVNNFFIILPVSLGILGVADFNEHLRQFMYTFSRSVTTSALH